jgi:hypothetical protein
VVEGAGNYGKARKILFYTFKIRGDADFEEKFLKRNFQNMTVDRDCQKTEWCKMTTEFRQECFHLRFFVSMFIIQEKYKRV